VLALGMGRLPQSRYAAIPGRRWSSTRVRAKDGEARRAESNRSDAGQRVGRESRGVDSAKDFERECLRRKLNY
jgi:hypothetical protein